MLVSGLILNFIGSLLLAFSIEKNKAGANQFNNGKKVYLTVLNENKFKAGVLLFALGFTLQLLDIIF